MGLEAAHNLARILLCRFQFPASSFGAEGSFEAFVNVLSNFASWADIFLPALEGACAIQTSALQELIYTLSIYLCEERRKLTSSNLKKFKG